MMMIDDDDDDDDDHNDNIKPLIWNARTSKLHVKQFKSTYLMIYTLT